MSDKNTGGCVGCLGSLAIFTFIGSLFFGGGILYRVGPWDIVLGKDPIGRQSIITNHWNELEGDKKVSDESSKTFRTQMAQGQYQAAYDQASNLFRKYLTSSQWITYCGTLSQNFGSAKSGQLQDAWVQPGDKKSEKYVLLRYLTTFMKAQMQEDFIWLVKDSKPELFQYSIYPRMKDSQNIQVMSLKN